MKRTCVALFIFFYSVVAGWADPLVVQSGEHAHFTRLVFPLPKNTGWTAQASENSARIELEDNKRGFDISSVFDRIDHSRLAALSVVKNALELTLNCVCDVAAFTVPGPFLVVDIADPGHSVTSPLPKKEEHTQPDKSKIALPNRNDLVLPWIKNAMDKKTIPENLHGTNVDHENHMAPSNLGAIEKRLVQQVSRALTKGILTPVAQPKPVEVAKPNLPPQPKQVRQPQLGGNLFGNMRLTTSSDIEPSQTLEQALHDTRLCGSDIPEIRYDTAKPENFIVSLSRLRSGLYGEFDKPDRQVGRELARLYISYGFGAEAMAVLQQPEFADDDDSVMLEIAQILEFGQAKQARALPFLTNCESDIALWAILSRREHPKDKVFNTGAALRALNKMPISLRKELAPILGDRLLQHGDVDAASAALRTLERLDAPLAGAAKLTQSDLAAAAGQESERHLKELIQEGSDQAPQALVRLIRSKLAAQEPLSVDLATLVESYAKEYDGTPLGEELVEVQIVALAQSGQFDRAFQALHDRQLSDSVKNRITNKVAMLLVKSAGDVEFLRHIYEQEPSDLASFSKEINALTAERLTSLGFPERARVFLADQSVGTSFGKITTVVPAGQETKTTDEDMWQELLNTLEPKPAEEITAMTVRELPIVKGGEGLLKRSQEALEESRQARGVINELLKQPALEPSG